MKITRKLFFLCLSLLSVSLCGCSNSDGGAAGAETDSQGLAFYLTDDDTYYVGKGTSEMLSEITIPEKHNGKDVVGVVKNGFESVQAKKITLPDSIVELGAYAFWDCENLKEITVPKNLEKMGASVFWINDFLGKKDNNGLYLGNDENPHMVLLQMIDKTATSFSIHKDCKFIQSEALQDSSIKSLTIPDGVIDIGAHGVCDCEDLASITLPKNLKALRKGVLRFGQSLKTVTIPKTVERIEEWAFANDGWLSSIVIPASVTVMEEYVFQSCASSLVINCEAAKKPAGWHSNWAGGNYKVVWGYKA